MTDPSDRTSPRAAEPIQTREELDPNGWPGQGRVAQAALNDPLRSPSGHDQSVAPVDLWQEWAKRTFGGDAAKVETATKAAKAALATGATSEQAVAAAQQAVSRDHSAVDPWGEWAKRTFGGDAAKVETATKAAKAALASGATSEQAVVAAQQAVSRDHSAVDPWGEWAMRTFGGDAAKVEAATKAAKAALARGATSEQAVAAAREAVQLSGAPAGEANAALAESWLKWAAATFPGDRVKAEAAAHAALEAVGSGAASAEAETAARNAASVIERQRAISDGDAESPPVNLGAYDYLVQDNSKLSARAVQLIDHLQMSRRPRALAFLGRRSPGHHTKRTKAIVGLGIVAWILIVASHVIANHKATQKLAETVKPVPYREAILVSLVLVALISFLYLLYATTFRYTLARGRLTVKSGLLARNQTTLELYRVTDIAIHRSLPNRLTQDGTLVIAHPGSDGGKPSHVLVTGLLRFKDLERTRDELMDLIFLLRSSPVIQRYMA